MATSVYVLDLDLMSSTLGLRLQRVGTPGTNNKFSDLNWSLGRLGAENGHAFRIGQFHSTGFAAEIAKIDGTVIHTPLTDHDYVICDTDYLVIVPDAELAAKDLEIPGSIEAIVIPLMDK